MLGVFRAACWPQQNIDPHAWAEDGSRGGSRFPLQVRVRMDSPTVLVLSEERVRSALEYRGSLNRFDLQMSKEAASSLALLFQQYGEPRPLQQAGLPMPMPMPGGGGPTGRGLKSEGGGGPSSGGPRGSGERSERSRRNGLVFICDPTTEKECLQRRLLGLPKSQSSLLSKLADTSLLFLFNVRTRQMLGVFAPDGPAGMEIEPDAWGGGGRFPVQVRLAATSLYPCTPALARPCARSRPPSQSALPLPPRPLRHASTSLTVACVLSCVGMSGALQAGASGGAGAAGARDGARGGAALSQCVDALRFAPERARSR